MPTFRSNENPMFRSKFSEDIFKHKYAHHGCETWASLASVLVDDVCTPQLKQDEKDQLKEYITDLKFIPGGRYLYYAGRPNKFFNNCYLLRAEEDTREDWANLSWKAESCMIIIPIHATITFYICRFFKTVNIFLIRDYHYIYTIFPYITNTFNNSRLITIIYFSIY